MRSSNQDLSEFYDSLSLSEKSVDRILALGKSAKKKYRTRGLFMGIAAALLFALLGSFFIPHLPTLETKVAASVLKNHHKDSSPSVFSSRLAEIENGLPRCDFPLTPSHPEKLSGWRVIGGRECTLYSEFAVQINLENATGQEASLYIAPHVASLAKVESGKVLYGSNSVEVWHDDGRIFALAQ